MANYYPTDRSSTGGARFQIAPTFEPRPEGRRPSVYSQPLPQQQYYEPSIDPAYFFGRGYERDTPAIFGPQLINPWDLPVYLEPGQRPYNPGQLRDPSFFNPGGYEFEEPYSRYGPQALLDPTPNPWQPKIPNEPFRPGRIEPFVPYPDDGSLPQVPNVRMWQGLLRLVPFLPGPMPFQLLKGLYLLWQLYEALRPGAPVIGAQQPGEQQTYYQLACGGGGTNLKLYSQAGAELCDTLLGSQIVLPSDAVPPWPGIEIPAYPPAFPNDYSAIAVGDYVRPTIGGQVWQVGGITITQPSFPPVILPGQVWVQPDVKPDVYTQPSPWSLPQAVSAMPGVAPFVGVQPAPIPHASITRFDRLAVLEFSPWIMREVGPSPGLSPQRLDQIAPRVGVIPRTSLFPETVAGPWAPPQVGQVTVPAPSVGLQPLPGGSVNVPPIYSTPVTFGPPGRRVREHKLRAPYALIHALAVSTYLGGTIRNLWQSLPPECKSKMHRRSTRPRRRRGEFIDLRQRRKRRTYQSMLNDIWHCPTIDWNKFAALELEMLAKYRLEGWALSRINRITRSVGGGPVVGLGTQVMHTTPFDIQPPNSPFGGAWHGRTTPFGPIDELQRAFNDLFLR